MLQWDTSRVGSRPAALLQLRTGPEDGGPALRRISCLATSAGSTTGLVVGAFDGAVLVADTRSPSAAAGFRIPTTHTGGGVAVMQLALTADGLALVLGVRQAPHSLLAYDLRCIRSDGVAPSPLWTLKDRASWTNQPLRFDLSGSLVLAGDSSGDLFLASLLSDAAEASHRRLVGLHGGAVSNVSLHPYFPLLATTSGERPSLLGSDGTSSASVLKLWTL